MINMSYTPSMTSDSTLFWIKLFQSVLLSCEMADMMTKNPALNGNKQPPLADPNKSKFVGFFFRTVQIVRHLDVILTVLYRIFLEAFLAKFLNICFEFLFNFLVSLNRYRVQPKYQYKNKYKTLSLKTLTNISPTSCFVIQMAFKMWRHSGEVTHVSLFVPNPTLSCKP